MVLPVKVLTKICMVWKEKTIIYRLKLPSGKKWYEKKLLFQDFLHRHTKSTTILPRVWNEDWWVSGAAAKFLKGIVCLRS